MYGDISLLVTVSAAVLALVGSNVMTYQLARRTAPAVGRTFHEAPSAPEALASVAPPAAAPPSPAAAAPIPAANDDARCSVEARGAATQELAPTYVAGRRLNADGTVNHLRRMRDAKAVEKFVQWMRDEADRPAASNDPMDVLERVARVSWMRPGDSYAYYLLWAREHAIIPENKQAFLGLVQAVPGVQYERHRLNGPEFQHIRCQVKSDRAWVVRIVPNCEMAVAARVSHGRTVADQARHGAGRSATGPSWPHAGREAVATRANGALRAGQVGPEAYDLFAQAS